MVYQFGLKTLQKHLHRSRLISELSPDKPKSVQNASKTKTHLLYVCQVQKKKKINYGSFLLSGYQCKEKLKKMSDLSPIQEET